MGDPYPMTSPELQGIFATSPMHHRYDPCHPSPFQYCCKLRQWIGDPYPTTSPELQGIIATSPMHHRYHRWLSSLFQYCCKLLQWMGDPYPMTSPELQGIFIHLQCTMIITLVIHHHQSNIVVSCGSVWVILIPNNFS